MDNPFIMFISIIFIMFISIILGTIIGRAITECLFKDGDKEIEKMKDEEMAEEYICIRKCQDDGKKSFVYCRTCTRLEDFLAGLKAGRPQWHDLRKDPNDLPKEYDIIQKAFGIYEEKKAPHIVLDQKGSKVYCIRTIGNHEKAWYWAYEDKDLGMVEYEVTHWCEIPTFDKE